MSIIHSGAIVQVIFFAVISTNNHGRQVIQYCPPLPEMWQQRISIFRALSMHMHTCNALFSCSTNDNTQKCTHMQLTLAQRAEQIFLSMKKPHTSGHQLNVDRLSVLHATSNIPLVPTNHGTDDDINVYNGDGDEYDTPDFTTECNPSIPSSTHCYQFDRDLNPPPGVKFCIHLQQIISSHRGVDLALYEEIIDLIKFHAKTQDTDFATNKLYHRNKLTKTLTELYNLNALQPQLHQVVLTDSSTVTVPVFDVKAVILSILHDPKRMQFHHFAPGYDIFSGLPTDTQYSYLDEIHTGLLWQRARDFYCGTDNDNFPLGLLCFYDKTHTDLCGSLSCAPFIITFSFLMNNNNNLINLSATLYAERSKDLFNCHVLHHSNPVGTAQLGQPVAGNKMNCISSTDEMTLCQSGFLLRLDAS